MTHQQAMNITQPMTKNKYIYQTQVALDLYSAPVGIIVGKVPPGYSVLVYPGERVGSWVQVEYAGKGAWAIIPKNHNHSTK